VGEVAVEAATKHLASTSSDALSQQRIKEALDVEDASVQRRKDLMMLRVRANKRKREKERLKRAKEVHL